MDWQPIETAPMDGSDIIAYPCFGGNGVFQVKWKQGSRKSGWIHWTVFVPIQPTHWMPLPSPPSKAKGE